MYPWHCLVPFLTNTTPSQPPQPAPPPTASPAPKYEHASPRGSQSDRLTAATTTATTAGGGDTGMYVFCKNIFVTLPPEMSRINWFFSLDVIKSCQSAILLPLETNAKRAVQ